VPVPVEQLLSKQRAAQRRAAAISRHQACNPAPDAALLAPPHIAKAGDTVYFCVVDGQGNACSFINSNYMVRRGARQALHMQLSKHFHALVAATKHRCLWPWLRAPACLVLHRCALAAWARAVLLLMHMFASNPAPAAGCLPAGLWHGHCARRLRVHPAEPLPQLHAARGAPQLPGAQEAAVPHGEYARAGTPWWGVTHISLRQWWLQC